MTVVGTRPEIIRLSRVIARLDEHCDHVLVHTGQNYDYELNQIFFDDSASASPITSSTAAGDSRRRPSATSSSRSTRCWHSEQPEAMLVLGDTNSCLAVHSGQAPQDSDLPHGSGQPLLRPARAGGDQPPHRRSHGRRQPDLQHDRPRVSAARGPAARSGDQDRQPDVRGADALSAEIEASDVLERLGLEPSALFRRQRAPRGKRRRGRRLRQAGSGSLNAVAEDHGLPVIVSTHPRTRKRIEAAGTQFHPTRPAAQAAGLSSTT